MSKSERYFKAFQNRFKYLSNQELIEVFNGQVGNNGWGTAKAAFLYSIHNELISRKIDFSAIGDNESLSFKDKIEIKNDRTIVKTVL